MPEPARHPSNRRPRTRPRILYVTHHLPFPPQSGGRRREFELLRRLGDRFEVHLIAVSKTPRQDLANASRMGLDGVEAEVYAAETASRNGDCALVALHRSEDARRRIASLLPGDYDAVHVEGFYLWPVLPAGARRGGPVMLVEHNIEYLLYEQRARIAGDPLTAKRMRREAEQTRVAELNAWRESALCVAVTDEDCAEMRAQGIADVALVPNGTDHIRGGDDRNHDWPPPDPNLAVMIANFGYEPNVDGAIWLCDEILPRVQRRVRGARLQLVGRDQPAQIRALGRRRGVEVTGPVPDVAPYLQGAAVFACPLRVGGGSKLKVLEAIGHGKAIVTTSVGVQGLGHEAQALTIRDEAEGFADALATLLEDPRRRRRLEEATRVAAWTLPTWDDAAEALAECYRRVAASQSSKPARRAPATVSRSVAGES